MAFSASSETLVWCFSLFQAVRLEAEKTLAKDMDNEKGEKDLA